MSFGMGRYSQEKVFGQFGSGVICLQVATVYQPTILRRLALRLWNILGILWFVGRLQRLLIGMAKFDKPSQSRRRLKVE